MFDNRIVEFTVAIGAAGERLGFPRHFAAFAGAKMTRNVALAGCAPDGQGRAALCAVEIFWRIAGFTERADDVLHDSPPLI